MDDLNKNWVFIAIYSENYTNCLIKSKLIELLVGSIFLGVCFYRQINYHFTRRQHVGLECGIWYWHFVDVVWLFLFIVVYIWGGN